MEKFVKLSRAEMKKIAGGSLCSCADVNCTYLEPGNPEDSIDFYYVGFNCSDTSNILNICNAWKSGSSPSCSCVSDGACE